jgi:hypothetical protein
MEEIYEQQQQQGGRWTGVYFDEATREVKQATTEAWENCGKEREANHWENPKCFWQTVKNLKRCCKKRLWNIRDGGGGS